jgi:hypothetical protein
MRMYPVYMSIPCTHIYHAHKLKKFTKNSDKIHTYSFSPTPPIYKNLDSNL